MKRVVSFEIKNTKSDIITKTGSCEKHLNDVHNDNVIYCAHNYVQIGDVVTFEVKVKGQKAADAFYSAVNKFEESFNVNSDFIRGSYMARVLSPKMKIS